MGILEQDLMVGIQDLKSHYQNSIYVFWFDCINMLKDKLRPIKFLRVYMSKNWFELSSAKPEVARSTLPVGASQKLS